MRPARILTPLTNGANNQPQHLHAAATNCIRSFNRASSSASALRLFLQTLFCMASVILGFRISQETTLVVLQFKYVTQDTMDRNFGDSRRNPTNVVDLGEVEALPALMDPDARLPAATVTGNGTNPPKMNTTGVHVGRHRILVREWPHPDPVETMRAFSLIAKVQEEQVAVHGVKNWKPVIAITPTHTRMFQALHLTGLMNTLSLVRGPVTWIVIEAGGISNNTAELLAQAQVHNVVHLGYPRPMPIGFEARWILESHLRLEGLRFVREKNLNGIIVFADDSNVYSLQFFTKIQKVNWVATIPMGVLGYTGFQDATTINPTPNPRQKRRKKERRRGSLLLGILHKGQPPPKIDLQVQTLAPWPALDASPRHGHGHGHGWHAHRPLPLDWDSGTGTAVLDEKLQWAGFVINSRAVWDFDKPHWIRDWKVWTRRVQEEHEAFVDLRAMVKDESRVEEVEDGGSVRHWWIRVEGRSDCAFPSRWALDSQPKIVLPAKSTPWLESAPESTGSNSTALFPSSQTKKIISSGNKSAARDGKSKRKRRGTRSRKSTASNQIDNTLIL